MQKRGADAPLDEITVARNESELVSQAYPPDENVASYAHRVSDIPRGEGRALGTKTVIEAFNSK
jgi:hypothetical protein